MDNFELAIYAASKASGVPKRTIASRSRKFRAVEARMLVILLLKADGHSDLSIGWCLSRSRVTILHSGRVANDTLSYSKAFRDKYNKAHEIYNSQKSLRAS